MTPAPTNTVDNRLLDGLWFEMFGAYRPEYVTANMIVAAAAEYIHSSKALIAANKPKESA